MIIKYNVSLNPLNCKMCYMSGLQQMKEVFNDNNQPRMKSSVFASHSEPQLLEQSSNKNLYYLIKKQNLYQLGTKIELQSEHLLLMSNRKK